MASAISVIVTVFFVHVIGILGITSVGSNVDVFEYTYGEIGDIVELKCPLETETWDSSDSVSSIKWTKGPNDAFVAQKFKIPRKIERYVNKDKYFIPELTITTLGIRNLSYNDVGIYTCSISFDSAVNPRRQTAGRMELRLYKPFELELHVLPRFQNDKVPVHQSIVYANATETFKIKCTANLGLPLPKLLWTVNGTKVTDSHRITTSLTPVQTGHLYTTSSELTINDVQSQDAANYTCLGFSDGIGAMQQQEDWFMLKVLNSDTGSTTSLVVDKVMTVLLPQTGETGKRFMKTTVMIKEPKVNQTTQQPSPSNGRSSAMSVSLAVICSLLVVCAIISTVIFYRVCCRMKWTAIPTPAANANDLEHRGDRRQQTDIEQQIEYPNADLERNGHSTAIRNDRDLNSEEMQSAEDNCVISHRGRDSTFQRITTLQVDMARNDSSRPLLPCKRNISVDSWEISPIQLQFLENGFLGQGEFGIVKMAHVMDLFGKPGTTKVAVKCLKGELCYIKCNKS
ncbi:uncharacterized protein LOC144433918 [Glandiceps talaboti]